MANSISNRRHKLFYTMLVTMTAVWTLVLCGDSTLDAQSSESESNSKLQNWPGWRGPLDTGEGPHADPPIRWSEEINVKWKTAIPGSGHSSPIVWDDSIFLTSAIPVGEKFEDPHRNNRRPGAHDNVPVNQRHQFVIVSINRADGTIRWQTKVNEQVPREGGHYTATLASASMVTDGNYVYASFGSYGIYCLDFDGEVVWEKQLGQMHTKHGHGEGASPALHGEHLIVNWDHEGASFIVALNAKTGEEFWRQGRDEVTSWSSPIIIEHDGKYQVVAAGTNRVRGYDLKSGKVIWECGGLSNNVVATPVHQDGIVYVGSSYETKSVFAINVKGATGDITGTDHVLWKYERRTPYVPSPLLYQGTLYYLRHYQGILTRLQAKTGEEPIGPFRLGTMRDIYASPGAANDKLYFVDRSGVTLIASHSQIPKVLGVNRLDDELSATPALVGQELFLRGAKFLYCIREMNGQE